MVKVNYDLLPVKTHYFFFMAAMGPILPFLPVIGKQLGVSEVVMGLIMSVIPILFLFAKPIFGFILDYFQSHRKTVFLTLVVSTTVFSALLWLVPEYKLVPVQQQVACGSILNCTDQRSVVLSWAPQFREQEKVTGGQIWRIMVAAASLVCLFWQKHRAQVTMCEQVRYRGAKANFCSSTDLCVSSRLFRANCA
ncbi:hypothetical protein J6590_082674 [Homalodisca vitripennis]|nr:hypothetical protein J6590_082674 [Homalodisca vitripennis]